MVYLFVFRESERLGGSPSTGAMDTPHESLNVQHNDYVWAMDRERRIESG